MTTERLIDAEGVRRQHLDAFGPQLGAVYHDLYNQCAWLYVKWHQFVELYGTRSERISLLNRAATLFFRIVYDMMWEDTLLHLTRLTDPASTGMGKKKQENITIRCLPDLISDEKLKAEIQDLVDRAIVATAFARDWRNRRIAHRDSALVLKKAKRLSQASQKHVNGALEAVSRILEGLNKFYLRQSNLRLNRVTETITNDALSILYVIRDGLEADERRRQRIREGKIEPGDFQGPRQI